MLKIRNAVLLVLMAALFVTPACALEVTVDPTTQFCFSSDDFSVSDADDGIFITAVPSANIANVYYGDRPLKAGDALTLDALNSLTLETSCVTQQTASVEYCTISEGKITGVKSLKMSIRPPRNEAPTAEASSFETYKNIANSGELKASDPEGKALTYALVDAPKHGTVELYEDGTFTYTPKENKVGNDSFTFMVTDDAGNTSETAKVSIKIRKPTDKATYSDMTDDPDQFKAMWLKDEEIFTGSSIGGHLCFSPDQAVNRGEFLVMVMNLVGADTDLTTMTSGFIDEAETPAWLQPYIASALSNGMITGSSSDGGVLFRPADAMTKAEAVVMMQNVLDLPYDGTKAVFAAESENIVPSWAEDAYAALAQAGIDLDLMSETDALTRRDAANMLYSAHCFIEDTAISSFYWLQ